MPRSHKFADLRDVVARRSRRRRGCPEHCQEYHRRSLRAHVSGPSLAQGLSAAAFVRRPQSAHTSLHNTIAVRIRDPLSRADAQDCRPACKLVRAMSTCA